MPEHAFFDGLPAYALGALGGEEGRRLDAHLAGGCTLCAKELRELAATASLLAYAAPARAVRPEVKFVLMQRVRNEERPLPSPLPFPPSARPERRALASRLALAAAVLLAAGLGALWLGARREATRLAYELGTARAEAVVVTERLRAREAETAWMRDPRVQIAMLKGLAGAENAKAKLLWHPGTKRAVLIVEGLPPLPLTKSYELWAFVGATPRPAGVFDAAAGGATVISLSGLEAAAERPTKFAVSVEPKGGGPTPTGSVVLLGENL